MKRALTILAAVIAIPLLAEEPAKTTTTADTAAKPYQPAPTVISAPVPAQAPDSPLVAAARRSNRAGKKPKNVITNETLLRGDGAPRVITTTNQPALKVPDAPKPTPEMKAAAKRENERKRAELEKDRTAAAKKQNEPEPTEETEEEGLFESEEAPPRDGQSGQKPPQG